MCDNLPTELSQTSFASAMTGRKVAFRRVIRSSAGIAGNAKASWAKGAGEVNMDVGGEDDGDVSGERGDGKATFDRDRVRSEVHCAAWAKTRTQASGTIWTVGHELEWPYVNR